MKDVTKAPASDHKRTAEFQAGKSRADLRWDIPLPTHADSAWRFRNIRSWPFAPSDSNPLTWWRKLPVHAFHEQERMQIYETLRHVDVLRGGDELRSALSGDAAAATATALLMMPIENIDFQTDITMTALLRCALDGNPSAALVLAQIVGLTDVGHPMSRELSVSWLGWGTQHSADPGKFGDASAVVLSALKSD